MIDTAFAMAPSGGAQGAGDLGGLVQILPIILIFVVFYFLLIRPQQQRAKEHKKLLDDLKKGDAIITQGGMYGKITNIADQIITVEIADKVRVRIARSHVAGLAASPPPAVDPSREG
jgi:preprotein translocase subunit YajC